MLNKQTLINQSKLDGGDEPTNKQRRIFFSSAVAALAASPLLVSPRRVMAQKVGQQVDTPTDPFILLLTGIYQPVPVGKGPNLGLTSVNLSDGSYSETRIYPVWGITNEGVSRTRTEPSAISSCSLRGTSVPTNSPAARLRCNSPVVASRLTPMGWVGSSWKEPSN
jgi:hypothetical protein